jgi:hypothetical protein
VAGSFGKADARGTCLEVTFSIFSKRRSWQVLDAGMLPKFDLDQIHGCTLLIESRLAPRLWSPDPPESASGPGLPHPPNPLSGATRGGALINQLPAGSLQRVMEASFERV